MYSGEKLMGGFTGEIVLKLMECCEW